MPVPSRKARALGATLIGALALLVPTPASASPPQPVVSPPIVDGLIGPLQIDVGASEVLVGQSFGGTVSAVSIRRGDLGAVRDLVSDPGVDGVAWGPRGSVLFTHTDFDAGVAEVRSSDGATTRTVADIRGFEDANNPDQVNTYGFQGLTPECEASLPPDQQMQSYQGQIDAHPYALALSRGSILVADAGGNDVLRVDPWGGVHLVAVLPPQPTVATPDIVAANGLPECVTGKTFNFEPVPTDVEVGRDGGIYVTTLPGGPEDASLGARGSVYRIDPRTGAATRLATGFLGATNLALAPDGTIYVAELFADRVSAVLRGNRNHPGGVVPVASLPSPAAVEWAKGRLFVGADAFGSGKLVTIAPLPSGRY